MAGEEKLVETGVEEVMKNEEVIKAVAKSAKGKSALLVVAGAGIYALVDKILVPAVKKVICRHKAADEIVDGEGTEDTTEE